MSIVNIFNFDNYTDRPKLSFNDDIQQIGAVARFTSPTFCLQTTVVQLRTLKFETEYAFKNTFEVTVYSVSIKNDTNHPCRATATLRRFQIHVIHFNIFWQYFYICT